MVTFSSADRAIDHFIMMDKADLQQGTLRLRNDGRFPIVSCECSQRLHILPDCYHHKLVRTRYHWPPREVGDETSLRTNQRDREFLYFCFKFRLFPRMHLCTKNANNHRKSPYHPQRSRRNDLHSGIASFFYLAAPSASTGVASSGFVVSAIGPGQCFPSFSSKARRDETSVDVKVYGRHIFTVNYQQHAINSASPVPTGIRERGATD